MYFYVTWQPSEASKKFRRENFQFSSIASSKALVLMQIAQFCE